MRFVALKFKDLLVIRYLRNFVIFR